MAAVPRTTLILLAAGSSTRMGSPKQLLLYNGKPLIRHVAEEALASTCTRVVVVLGSNAVEISPALDGLDVEIVTNDRWAEGMGTSIQSGIRAAQSHGSHAIILALADQPLITVEVYNRLIRESETSGQPIVTSQYAGTVGVPVFFTEEFYPHLLALEPSQGCEGVILANTEAALRIDCPEADIDTPGDSERLAPCR